MKMKISISIDKNKLNLIEKKLKNGIFRNKSHFIELAVDKLLQEVEIGGK